MIDRSAKERGQDVGTRSGRVFRDVADGKARFDGNIDGFGAPLCDEVDVPVFCVLTNGARTNEGIHFDGDARALGNFDHGRDVGDDRATRTGHLDLHLAVSDFFADARHVFERAL